MVIASCILTATGSATAETPARFAGSAGKMDNAASASEIPITLLASQNGSVLNINTNWFTKYVERRFGLKFKFNLSADESDKQSLLLSTNQYPDAIFVGDISQTDALDYGSKGIFVPLNGLIKHYAPYLWHIIQTSPYLKEEITAPNGKIYALASNQWCVWCSWVYKYYINLKDLNAFHLTMPKTTAEFSHVLAVFKRHGLVPLTGASNGYATEIVPFLMNAFIPYNGNNLDVTANGKKAFFAPAQKAWERGLEYIHGLYAKGYFSETAFTQEETAVEQLIAEQKVGVVPDGAIQTAIPHYADKDSHYLDWWTIPALKGPDGVQSASFGTGIGGMAFAITNKASRAQRVRLMKFLNFIFTPTGTEMSLYGPKGKYWQPAKKGQLGTGGTQALFTDSDQAHFAAAGAEQNVGWSTWFIQNLGATWENGQVADPTFSDEGVRSANALATITSEVGHQPKYQYPQAVWTSSQTYATEQTNLDNYVQQWTDEFVTGQRSLPGDWSSYLAGLRRLGLENYVKTSQGLMHAPLDTDVPAFEISPSEDPALTKFYLSEGPVPRLFKKYLIQSGVPASDFPKSR